MAEPAQAPEPRGEPHRTWEPAPEPKMALSGFAIWSLILGLLGATVIFLPGLLENVIVLPSAFEALAGLRGLMAVSSVLAVVFGAIAMSQILQRSRRGIFLALFGGTFGIIGLLGYLFL